MAEGLLFFSPVLHLSDQLAVRLSSCPEFANHILHLDYKQYLKLCKIRPADTQLPEQNRIFIRHHAE